MFSEAHHCIRVYTDCGELLHVINTAVSAGSQYFQHLVVGTGAHFYTHTDESILQW